MFLCFDVVSFLWYIKIHVFLYFLHLVPTFTPGRIKNNKLTGAVSTCPSWTCVREEGRGGEGRGGEGRGKRDDILVKLYFF